MHVFIVHHFIQVTHWRACNAVLHEQFKKIFFVIALSEITHQGINVVHVSHSTFQVGKTRV
jgi:hypothetical protein